MSYSDDYSNAIKYSANDLLNLSKSVESKALINKATAGDGDNLPLLALADHFDEHNHPLGNYIRRVASGEGVEGDDYDQRRLNYHSARPSGTSLGHFDYPVVGGTNDPYVRHSYYKLPTGHFFHISMGGEKPEQVRSFLLPVNDNEVHQYMEDMKRFNDDYSTREANTAMEATAKAPAPEPNGIFDRDVAAAHTPLSPNS